MSEGNESLGGTDDTNRPLAGGPALSEPDMEAIDLLIEHRFDLDRATAARPDLSARLAAASRLFSHLDAYPVESPDASLTDATMARINHEERAREARMHVDSARAPSVTSGRWPDLWALACVALIVVAVGLPLANWMNSRAAQAQCGEHLRALGGGIERYVNDHQSMPFQASVLPDFRSLSSWTDLDNNSHLRALTTQNYAEPRCLCCPNDPTGEGYAYQVPNQSALRAWRIGARVPVVADRSPVIELTRAGKPIGQCIVNSPDHDGVGQNALFTDASVDFIRSATMMVPQIDDMPRHLENIYLPMSASERGRLEEGLDKPSDWIRLDVFLLN